MDLQHGGGLVVDLSTARRLLSRRSGHCVGYHILINPINYFGGSLISEGLRKV